MKALVIGGAGFIGSHVVERLLRDGHRVTVFDSLYSGSRENLAGVDVNVIHADMRDGGRLHDAIKDHVGCTVYLLAAKWLLDCNEDPDTAWAVNTECARRVAVLCKQYECRLVFSSSASVYGNAVTTPMTEDHPLNGAINTYGATKIAAEAAIASTGVRHAFLRYANVYGPRQNIHGAYSGVIPRWMLARIRGERCRIDSPDATYDFVYVGDVARANVLAGRAIDYQDLVLNVSTGLGTTLSALYDAVAAATPDSASTSPVYGTGTHSGGFVSRRVMSYDRAYIATGWEPEVPLSSGLRHMAEWARSCAA